MRNPRQKPELVTLGVDTHAEQHVAAAPDERGRLLGTCTIPTTSTGFAELVRWASECASLIKWESKAPVVTELGWPAGCALRMLPSSM